LVDGEESAFLRVGAAEDGDARDVTCQAALSGVGDEGEVVDYRGRYEAVGVDDELDR
jgi:hypothetical protein